MKREDNAQNKDNMSLYVKGLSHWSDGNVDKVPECFEEILEKHPLDPLALLRKPESILLVTLSHFSKVLKDVYYFLGWIQKHYETIQMLSKHYKPCNPLYGYFKGMQAFASEENNQLTEAEECATTALDIHPHDGWAAHAMAHSLDTRGHYRKGVEFMEQHEHFWSKCDSLATHCYW
jgi:tetratricopeptide (TPR) repeat protein